MKSMCQEARRNSPSVAVRSPMSPCMRTTSAIASSSIPRSSAASISPAAYRARASSRFSGRSRLPTWSARSGGPEASVMPPDHGARRVAAQPSSPGTPDLVGDLTGSARKGLGPARPGGDPVATACAQVAGGKEASVKLGVHLVTFEPPGGPTALGPVLAAVGRAADDAGIANLSVMDHYLQLEMIGDADRPMLEGYTTLGFLAAANATAELQLLCTGVTYRHPGLLAKIVSTLDVLSGGRAVLGIGAAWYEREHRALGVPFPPLAERFELLEETLRIVRQMWSEDDGPFEGTHYRLAETLNSPQPLRRPHPPIMIGGGGERKTLRLVAQYADACNLFASARSGGPAAVEAKLQVLRDHCQREGTDYDAIAKTILYVNTLLPGPGAGEKFADEMSGYLDLGVTEVHVMPMDVDPVAFVDN